MHSYGDNVQSKTHDSPFDYTAHFESLETQCSVLIDKLKTDITKLRAGVRNDSSVLESIQVVLNKSTGASASLQDIAHVLPKGRSLVVNVYEAAVSTPRAEIGIGRMLMRTGRGG